MIKTNFRLKTRRNIPALSRSNLWSGTGHSPRNCNRSEIAVGNDRPPRDFKTEFSLLLFLYEGNDHMQRTGTNAPASGPEAAARKVSCLDWRGTDLHGHRFTK